MNRALSKRGLPARVDFETHFDDILISSPTPGDVEERCANQNPRAFNKLFKQNIPAAHNYTHPLLFSLQAFYACYSTELRGCNNPGCKTYRDLLISRMPQCTTWPGLQEWALQAAACLCYCERNHSDSKIANHVAYACNFVDGRQCRTSTAGPRFKSYARKTNFTNWARHLNTHDVWLLISWLGGIATGAYSHIPVPRSCFDADPTACAYDDLAVNRAISRALDQGLCPRRIWAIAMNLPGRESNIPVLIPDKPLHNTDCSSRHNFCSMGPAHRSCTFEACEISAVNFTNVVQRHRPGCDGKCERKQFPVHLLDKAANRNRPTAWAIDGELRPLKRGKRYIAISHVWSDGTGGNGTVHECLYNFFCDVARSLKCQGLWWDAICIPQDRQARAKAINRMHSYYSKAAYTVVHDLCLATSEWVDSDRASFALVMSNWFTRGWTALELAKSQKVQILFRSTESPGFVLRNLNDDILCNPGCVSSLSGLAASAAIRALQEADKHRLKQRLTVNDILTSLGPRFTSWARDRAVIAGLFVGIEKLADDQHEIYRQVICKIGRISTAQLFHNASSISGPFSWFPTNLFDLPSSKTPEKLRITKEGDVVGDWMIIFDLPPPLDSEFFWDMTHPVTKCRIRAAMRDFNRHVILVEAGLNPAPRGVLVKIMKDKEEIADAFVDQADEENIEAEEKDTDESEGEEDEDEKGETDESETDEDEEESESGETEAHKIKVLCRFVGPVHFRTPQHVPDGTFDVRIIGAGGDDLDADVSASHYLKSKGAFKDKEATDSDSDSAGSAD